jgi:large subunit ribosomal protein L19e
LCGSGEPVILTRTKQIHRAKAEKARERQIKEEMDAKRARTKAARERKQERQTAKRNALAGEDEEETK